VTQTYALANENGIKELFVVQGSQTGCNSLRPPVVFSGTAAVHVEVTRLDDWLAKQKIDRVDFIKLDVEGAELAVLEGAEDLFQRRPRPVLLAEVQDVRTKPWGYQAREIVQFLKRLRYSWFQLLDSGSLQLVSSNLEVYDANLVALPTERMDEISNSLGKK